MENVAGFDFFELEFDEQGLPKDPRQIQALLNHAPGSNVTDAIFLAHGFRNNQVDATGLYTRFLTNFRTHLNTPLCTPLQSRRFAVGGVYWPSKPFPEEDDAVAQSLDNDLIRKQALLGQLDDLQSVAVTVEQRDALSRAATLVDHLDESHAAQDEFADLVRTVVAEADIDAAEGIDKFQTLSGSDLFRKLTAAPIILSRTDSDDDGGIMAMASGAGAGYGIRPASGRAFVPADGGALGIGSIFQSIKGSVGHFLNLTLWYVMKSRSGIVGANGTADVVRAVGNLPNAPKIHLVGHSLGGRLMASCAKSLAQNPLFQPDSLTLLEAAFSHYGFSASNVFGTPGLFRDVITRKVVKGPMLATFSASDSVVGKIYAIASRIAGDNVRAVGDEYDPYGGIGRNGAQLTDVSLPPVPLEPPASLDQYTFPSGKLVNLNGSNGLITDHGDITNPAVTFAFASAVAST